MTHHRRIIDARGNQPRHGHDRQDKAHSALPLWRGHSTARLALASDPVLCFHGKMLGVLPVGHRPDMKQDIPANSTRQIVEAVQAEIILMAESVGAP